MRDGGSGLEPHARAPAPHDRSNARGRTSMPGGATAVR